MIEWKAKTERGCRVFGSQSVAQAVGRQSGREWQAEKVGRRGTQKNGLVNLKKKLRLIENGGIQYIQCLNAYSASHGRT